MEQRTWDRLKKNHLDLRKKISGLGYQVANGETQILPVILGKARTALRASEMLKKSGFYVPAIRYPTVRKGEARLRISVSAAHRRKDLTQLVKAMQKVRASLGKIR